MDQICRLCNWEVSDSISLFSEDSIERFGSGEAVWWTLTLEAINDHLQDVIVSLVIASQIILPPGSSSARAVMSAVGCTVSTDWRVQLPSAIADFDAIDCIVRFL